MDLTMKVSMERKTLDKETEYKEDYLAVESPLTIYLNEQEIVTMLCTPEFLKELAIGFLVAESMIRQKDDIISIELDEDKGAIWIEGVQQPLAEKMFSKRFLTTGCGKGTTFYNVLDAQIPPVVSDFKISLEKVLNFMKEAQYKSNLFQETGGVHGNALCDNNGLIMFRDDIGRHNAADKILGSCFLDGVDMGDKVLLTTGRISSEILIKVARMGIPIIVSRSAPTALAVNLAEKLAVTVVGFTRANRCNVYTHPERVK